MARVVDRLICLSKHHDTTYAYKRYRCRCPQVVARMREMNRRQPRVRVRPRQEDLIDWVAVRMVLRTMDARCGQQLLRVEKHAVIILADRLSSRGVGTWSSRQLAGLVGVSPRTVIRRRRAIREHIPTTWRITPPQG